MTQAINFLLSTAFFTTAIYVDTPEEPFYGAARGLMFLIGFGFLVSVFIESNFKGE